MNSEALQRLEEWYRSQCDGDWEHSYGIKITTLDNPGWSIRIAPEGTSLEGLTFERMREDRSDTDWIHCGVADDVFVGFGGHANLRELILVFLDWWRESTREDH